MDLELILYAVGATWFACGGIASAVVVIGLGKNVSVFADSGKVYGKNGKGLQGVFRILEDEASPEQFKLHSIALPECS